MKLKKWLSAIFAVVMVISLLPAAALATEGTGDEVSSEQPTSSVTEVEEPTTPSSEDKTEGEGDELDGQVTEPSEGPVLPQAVNSASVEPTTDGEVAVKGLTAGNPVRTEEEFTAAIEAAKPGDTIYVDDVTLSLSSNYFITKAVSIQGSGVDSTVISGALVYNGFTNADLSLSVSNLTIQAPAGNTGIRQAILWSNNGKLSNAKLTVENCKIVNYMFGVGVNSGASGCTLNMSNVVFDNVWCGANVSDKAGNDVGSWNVSGDTIYEIQRFGESYNNYYEEFDGNAIPGDNVNMPDNDDWPAVAVVNGEYYGDLQDAIDAASGTVTLVDDVELESKLVIDTDSVTLDLDGHMISAADGFAPNNSHLVEVLADSVAIENGTLKSSASNRHTLNIWSNEAGKTATLKNLVIDHTNAASNEGAPLVVNAYDVTVEGKLTLTTGKASWYAMNLECGYGDASISFANDSTLEIQGPATTGIKIENSRDTGNTDNAVEVDLENATVTADNVVYLIETNAENEDSIFKVTPSKDVVKVGNNYVFSDDVVATVNGQNFLSLQEAVDAAAKGNGIIELLKDIDGVTVKVPAGADITVNGNGHTLTLAAGATGVFNGVASDNTEGLQSDTSLAVNSVNFKGASDSQTGHAVITGLNASGVNVTLSGCTFENLHDAVYCNAVTDSDAEANTISIADSTFTNVAYIYGVDDGATAGARTDAHSVTLENVSGAEESETFAVASVDGVGYTTLADAVAAAGKGDTVTLLKDASLDEMLSIATDGIILDLNGKTITASENFTSNWSNGNDSHLVQVLDATGVTIKNGTIETTAKNKHAVNIYGAEVTLEGLTVDHTNASTGAPVVIGGSDVTLSGKITVISGENSWYGINLDSRDINGTVTDSSLIVSKDAVLTFEGEQPIGIYVENTCAAEDGKVSLSFGENVTIASDIPEFVAVVYAKDLENATVDGADNAGLETDENGNLIIHEHVFGTEWVSDAAGHWHVCDCGDISDYAAHTFKWVIDKDATATEAGSKHEVCTVCGYEKAAVEIPATGTPTDPTDPTNPGDNTNTGDNSNTGSNTNTGSNNNAGSNANNSPKTSDNSMITVAVVVLVVACLGVALLLVYNGKIKSAYHGKRNADR